LNEGDYLPQSPGALFDGGWLVFAPHADDETFGMGGTIALARAAGIDVHVVLMTDGALGGVSSGSLMEAREREMAQALTVLGGASFECWRQPDRGLLPQAEIVARVAALVGSGKYRSVFFPAFTEPHPDHRATARIVWDGLRRAAFPALPVSYDISAYGPCNRLLDISPVHARKQQAMAVYASQQAERPYTEKVLAFNRSRTWSLPLTVEYAESFYVYDPCDCDAEQMLARVLARYLEGLRTPEEVAVRASAPAFPTDLSAPPTANRASDAGGLGARLRTFIRGRR